MVQRSPSQLHAGADLGEIPLLEMAATQQRGNAVLAGFVGRIHKPVRGDHLARALGAVLPRVEQPQILLVEDSGLKVVQLLLEKAGYHTDVVRSCTAAEAALASQAYAVVLIDCDLPLLDCQGTSNRLRNELAPGIAIVGLGGEARLAGVDAYLEKPVVAAKLIETIKMHLQADRSV